ncbi:MAG: hypothetical protein CME62_08100 [Halobacteriovoraceae bacterium]|nr:hypothetical protein [Halobacteriovoraceae bacterium]
MSALIYQHSLARAMRNFFYQESFVEVFPPPMVTNPGMETHIHPFEVYSKSKKCSSNLYLNTSPEFKLKEVLATNEVDNIFSLGFAFRDEPTSSIHRPQFLMLEWYRKNHHYEKIMEDCESLLHEIQTQLNPPQQIQTYPRVTVQELFLDLCQFDILQFQNPQDLKLKIQKDFKDIPLPESECSWDDYFFLIFLNKVEPVLKEYPYLLIYEYPAPLSALSTLKESDPRVCERFEIYLGGIEICNSFNELTDAHEQIKRFKRQAQDKKELYDYELPWPADFIDVLKKGYPKSAGIAMGLERLILFFYQTDDIFLS